MKKPNLLLFVFGFTVMFSNIQIRSMSKGYLFGAALIIFGCVPTERQRSKNPDTTYNAGLANGFFLGSGITTIIFTYLNNYVKDLAQDSKIRLL